MIDPQPRCSQSTFIPASGKSIFWYLSASGTSIKRIRSFTPHQSGTK